MKNSEIEELIKKEIDKTRKLIEVYKEETKPVAPDCAIDILARNDAMNNMSRVSALLQQAKAKLGFDQEKSFFVSEDVLFETRAAVEKGDLEEALWKEKVAKLSSEKKELLANLQNPDFSKIKFPDFSGQKVATRDSNGKILNAIAKAIPGFLGGSADLGPSNKTELKEMGTFPNGRNLHYGIREHAMAAINNAFARYGLFIPFSATFFIFSDYMKNSVRMAAIMGLKHYFIFTHDSIGVGEDGPTHQPIEQLSTFRAMPNFYTFRPADGNENVLCWEKALELSAPSAFVCSRQGLEPLPEAVFGDVKNGGYLVKESKDAKITLISSGSEVEICLKAANLLESKDIKTNVVSVPCFELFCEQSKEYLAKVLNKESKILAVEAASGLEWYKFADEVLGMSSFGESAKAQDLYKHFGFSDTNIANKAKELLD